MEEKKRRTLLVVKRLGLFIGTLFILVLIFKFAVYFMPFLIASIIALIIEPVIKFLMEKFNISRRLSSSIIITLTIILIISLVMWGGIFAINRLLEISDDIGPLITSISNTFENEVQKISDSLSKYLPTDVINTITVSVTEFFSNTGIYIENVLTNILKFILSVPTIIVNVIVTILALIFFSVDRIYILDAIEHHFPKKWIKKLSDIIKNIYVTLGCYIKAYGKIMILTFAELFFSFAVLKAIGFRINNILMLSTIIAIVDILPIFGVGTVLIPWIIWQVLIGNIKFAIALGIVYLFILIIRQLIEPKLVSKQLGIHPLTTLIAMYAGFKSFGFIGLIFGPIILMILMSIFAKPIEKGFFKELFDMGT